jgi:hypothetical protein
MPLVGILLIIVCYMENTVAEYAFIFCRSGEREEPRLVRALENSWS